MSTKIINAAERAKLAEALKNGASREEVVRGMMKTYCGKEYGLQHWYSGLNDTWASPGGKPASEWDKLLALGNGLEQLALDFGFMTHLPEFLMLAQEGKVKTNNWQEARESLKEQLGYKELWRGMTLSEEELNRVKNFGIKALFLRADWNGYEPIKLFEKHTLPSNPSAHVEEHFHRQNELSPFVSVSENRNLALATGKRYGNYENWKKIEKKTYLFKLRIPEIDIIYYTPHAINAPSYFERFRDRVPAVVFYDGEKKEVINLDRKGESLLYLKINPDEILEITQPETRNVSLSC